MFFVYQVFHMDEGISHHQNQCSCLGRGGPVEQCLLSLWQTSGMVKLSAQIMQLMMSELRCHYKKQTMPLSDGPVPMNSHIDSQPACAGTPFLNAHAFSMIRSVIKEPEGINSVCSVTMRVTHCFYIYGEEFWSVC